MLKFLGWKVQASLFTLSRFSGVSVGEHSGVLQAQWSKNSPRNGTLRAEKSKRQGKCPRRTKDPWTVAQEEPQGCVIQRVGCPAAPENPQTLPDRAPRAESSKGRQSWPGFPLPPLFQDPAGIKY